MFIPYPQSSKLELWVVDSGSLDTVAIFLNQRLIDLIADQRTHKFPIDRPPSDSSIAIAVHFKGEDGGFTAIVDVTGDQPRAIEKLGPRDGFRHSFLLKGT